MFRKVTDQFWVAPQLGVEDVARAAAEGVRVLINNRPDDEEPGQPDAEAIGTLARSLGLTYVFAPVHGGPGPDAIAAVRQALDGGETPILAYCRSGTRSILTWAAAEVGAGRLGAGAAVAAARNAGYDISRWM
jgi:uncharacterized protein (TIGR01244 family)